MEKNFDLGVILFAYNEKDNLYKLLDKIIINLYEFERINRLFISICIQGDKEAIDDIDKIRLKNKDKNKLSIDFQYYQKPQGIKKSFLSSYEGLPTNIEHFLTMDCDLNHDPNDCLNFFNYLDKGYDVVIGSRYIYGGKILGMSKWKVVLSYCFNYLISIYLRFDVFDKTSGFRLIKTKNMIDTIKKTSSEGFPFYAEFLLHLKREGKKIVESPIIFKSRTKGISKMKIFKTIVDYLVLLKIIFTNRIKS